MTRIDNGLVEDAKHYVTILLTNELSDKCLFHTIKHTLEVLKNAEIIGKYCNISEEELNILRFSALFHDVGYVDAYDDHEKFSAKRAKRFLASNEVDKKIIRQIEKAILSTKTLRGRNDRPADSAWHRDHKLPASPAALDRPRGGYAQGLVGA